jgi:hypothetical protein
MSKKNVAKSAAVALALGVVSGTNPSTKVSDLIGTKKPRARKNVSEAAKQPAAKKPAAKKKATPKASKAAKKPAKSTVTTPAKVSAKKATKAAPIKVSKGVSAKRKSARRKVVKPVSAPATGLNFSRGRSFNRNDTTHRMENGRIVIDQSEGVRVRCELALTAVLANSRVGFSDLLSHVNAPLKHQYSEGDLRYALGRLRSAGLVNLNEDTGAYSATSRALAAWRRVSAH